MRGPNPILGVCRYRNPASARLEQERFFAVRQGEREVRNAVDRRGSLWTDTGWMALAPEEREVEQ